MSYFYIYITILANHQMYAGKRKSKVNLVRLWRNYRFTEIKNLERSAVSRFYGSTKLN